MDPFRRKAAPATADELWALQEEDGSLTREPVLSVTAQAVTTPAASYPRSQLRTYFKRGGGRVFLARVDLPGLMDAQEARQLQQSNALRAIFAPNAPPPPVPLPVWLIIFSLILVLIIHR